MSETKFNIQFTAQEVIVLATYLSYHKNQMPDAATEAYRKLMKLKISIEYGTTKGIGSQGGKK